MGMPSGLTQNVGYTSVGLAWKNLLLAPALIDIVSSIMDNSSRSEIIASEISGFSDARVLFLTSRLS